LVGGDEIGIAREGQWGIEAKIRSHGILTRLIEVILGITHCRLPARQFMTTLSIFINQLLPLFSRFQRDIHIYLFFLKCWQRVYASVLIESLLFKCKSDVRMLAYFL
jgi:hypothetical protein